MTIGVDDVRGFEVSRIPGYQDTKNIYIYLLLIIYHLLFICWIGGGGPISDGAGAGAVRDEE